MKLPYIQYRKGILVFAKGGNKPVPVTILLNQSEIQVRSSLIWIHAQPTHLIYIPCGEDPAEIRLLPKQELAFYQEEDGPQVVTLSLP